MSIVGIGSATITATVTDGTNYTYATKTASYTVAVGTATMSVTASGFTGTYDGKAHGITVTPPDSATVKYGTAEGMYTLDASPTYTDVGIYTVYYQVTKANYTAVTGSATVSISKASGRVAFFTGNITVNLGEDFTIPQLALIPEDAALTYKSSDENVATVDDTGEIKLVGVGTTRITVTFAGNKNYTADSDYFDLTVVARLEPIVKETDYEMTPSDFIDSDGKDVDLRNTVINNILFTLKNTESPEGDGYDPDDQAIVLNTEQNPAAVNDILTRGVAPGSTEYADLLTGISFLLPAGEGFLNVESQEAHDCCLMVQIGSAEPVSIYDTRRHMISIPHKSDRAILSFAFYGGSFGRYETGARMRTVMKGKKTVGNVKVFKISYKAKAASQNGIQTVGLDGEDADAKWYDLNGRRIEKPQKKGLYIRNGQKVVIR